MGHSVAMPLTMLTDILKYFKNDFAIIILTLMHIFRCLIINSDGKLKNRNFVFKYNMST